MTPFPAQKKSYKEKNLKWMKDCVDAGESYSIWRDQGLRKSYYNKKTNFDLYSDILDPNDIEKTCNPFGVLGLNAPAKMQNYPICNPKIDVLVGESIKRRFEWIVKVVNDEAISKKEEELKEMFTQLMTSHLTQPENEETAQKQKEELANFQKFSNFEYQDLRERTATHILKYLWHQQRMEQKFATGFKDALIGSEEIYQADIIAGEPVFLKHNCLNVFTVRSGESNLIEDSDIIMIVSYMSPGKVIDDYHEYLKPHEVDTIESGFNTSSANNSSIDIGRKPDLALKLDESIDLAVLKGNMDYGYGVDTEGNIRVAKVYWASLRKMLNVKSYDEFGDPFYHLEDETYKIDKTLGEEAKELWIKEWWEGHKIGGGFGTTEEKAIYVKMQPRPIQFRSMENPSKCHPGIIGTVYNTNDNQGVSLMDRMKPYQYMYNILAYNTELAVSKNYGKIMRLNLAEIPENWQIDQWLSFAQGMNIAVYDSFKEGNKGAAQGKLAGSMNQNSPVIDMEMGNTIQLYMNMMAFIKQQMGEIAGVSDQRQGQIENREAVGNVERSVTQSNAITEYWFMEHEYVKLRCLEVLLETAKYAWKDKANKKIQFVTDDGSIQILTVDGPQFNECEYGLQITTQNSVHELIGAMKQLAQAGLQNGMIKYSQLLDIYSMDSISSIRRKIEKSEMDKEQAEAEQRKQQAKMNQDNIIANAKEAEKARDFQREQWDREDNRNTAILENKLEVERLRQDNNDSSSFQQPMGDNTSDLESLRQQAAKINADYQIKMKQHEETVRSNKKNEELKEKDIEAKKSIAKNKPKTGK